MENLYEVTLPANRLRYATDMLRYDGAYDITVIPANSAQSQTMVRLKLCKLTPGRWKSFNVDIEKYLPISYKMPAKEHDLLYKQAYGFLCGLRFFQKWLRIFPEDHVLVEDY